MKILKSLTGVKDTLLTSLTKKNIIIGSIIIILIGLIVGISYNSLKSISDSHKKDKLIEEQQKIIQQNKEKINELLKVLPIYYDDIPKEKLDNMSSVDAKKAVMINNLVKEENINTVKESKILLSANNPNDVKHLMKKYGIKNLENKSEIIQKVHPIPIKLPLAQAVTESSLGQYKLAAQTNNYWGILTFNKKGARLEKFPNLEVAIERYFQVLNRSSAMKKFRQIRLVSEGSNFKKMAYALDGTYCQTSNFNYGKALILAANKF